MPTYDLLSAFAEAHRAANARKTVKIAKAANASPLEKALEEALAYRIECRWHDYYTLSLGDFAASRISDAEYIEAMFQQYSQERRRLL